MKIVATIEARMGSSRLPKKSLIKIFDDMNLLEIVIRRFQLCKNIDELIVATSFEKQDNVIANWCMQHNINCYRGSEEDVLDRVTKAASTLNADAIAQMGADSAYLDFELIDELIETYKIGSYHYVCNDLHLSYPLGIYGHIVNLQSLIILNEDKTLSQEDREDVVRYIWEHPQEYNIKNITSPKEKHYPQLRLTIDYPEDLELAKAIYMYFDRFDFTTQDIINLYQTHPSLFKDVSHLVQVSAPFLGTKHE